MKTKLLLSAFFTFVFYLLSSQIPHGFNYQAIARDGSGNPIVGATIKVKLSILSDTLGFRAGGGTYVWEEEHINVLTNAYGLFNIVLGDPGATKVQGVASFSVIDWNQPKLFIGTKIANPSTYKVLGGAKLWSVPYSLVAGELGGTVDKIKVKGTEVEPDSALFEVKNKNGQIVFAVYNEGVRVYVDDGVKGNTKGGFAIGGFGTDKGTSQNYLMVSRDSIRAYVNDTISKGITKGGFAIGGFGTAKGKQEYFRVTRDSTRIYVNDTGTKGNTKGGFAIGGFDTGKGDNNSFFNVLPDSTGKVIPAQNKILWYPLKNALLTGKVLIENKDSVGVNSFASGYQPRAKGRYSQAMGFMPIARGNYSTAIGKNAEATGASSFAFGDNPLASGEGSYAFGSTGRLASGVSTGVRTTASGQNSMAFGMGALSNNIASAAFGNETQALGKFSTAMGYKSKANHDYSLASGYEAVADAPYSVAIGYQTWANGQVAIALGANCEAREYSAALGFGNKAYGLYSTAFGFMTEAFGDNSTASGWSTGAWGNGSFTSGYETEASGDYSTALGKNTKATGRGSFAIGELAKAKKDWAFAFGRECETSGYYSFVFGQGIKSTADYTYAIALNNQSLTTLTQSNTMAIMGGNVGIGTTTPSGKLDIRGITRSATTTGAGAGAGQFQSWAEGTAQGQIAAYSFYPTFQGTADNGPRRAADILGGFNGGAWGTEYLSFNVGSSSDAQIVTNEKMRIRADGKVGIGTIAPDYTLDVAGPVNLVKGMGTAIALRANGVEALWSNGTYFSWGAGGTYNYFIDPVCIGEPSSAFGLSVKSAGEVGRFWREEDGVLLQFTTGVTLPIVRGNISVSGTIVSYNAFTGSHYARVKGDKEKGQLVALAGTNSYIANDTKSEIIYDGVISSEPNSENILGAYLGKLEPDKSDSYDLVMAVGNGVMWVIDNGDDIKTGDYLISSTVPGNAMKENGNYETANIIGRAAEPVVWSEEDQMINGVKHKLISVFFENFKIDNSNQKMRIEFDKLLVEYSKLKEEIEEIKNQLNYSNKK